MWSKNVRHVLNLLLGSLIGRTPDSEFGDSGSIPRPAANSKTGDLWILENYSQE